MGNQNLYIWEEQTTQWQREKVQKNIQRNTKRTHKSKNRITRTPLKTNDQGYSPLVVNTSRSFPPSCVITGFVTRLTRRVPLVVLELPTLPEHLSSPPDFSGIPVTRSLVLWVCFVDRCLYFFPFGHCVVCTSFFWPLCCLYFCLLAIVFSVLLSFGHCVVCTSSIYGFWKPLWYLQTLLMTLYTVYKYMADKFTMTRRLLER